MSEERICEVCKSLLPVDNFRWGIHRGINAICLTCYNVRREKILSFANGLLRFFEDEYLETGSKAVIWGRRRRSRAMLLKDRGITRDEQVKIFIDRLRGLAVGDYAIAIDVDEAMLIEIGAAMLTLGHREFCRVAMPIRRRKIRGVRCSNESKIWRTK